MPVQAAIAGNRLPKLWKRECGFLNNHPCSFINKVYPQSQLKFTFATYIITLMMMQQFDSIIFDLDGTLWDSTANVAAAWQKARRQVNYIHEEINQQTVRSITGMPYDAIFEKLFPYLDNDTRKHFQTLCAQHELDTLGAEGGQLYPQLEDTLLYLKHKYRLFIVSNCQSGYIEIFLDRHHMGGYFEAHQCYGTKGQPKFQNIKDIVADYKLKAPVYVGDTTGDRDAAQKAGLPFIYAAYGFGQVNDGYLQKIIQFADLQRTL